MPSNRCAAAMLIATSFCATLHACKPPPTDADMAREMPVAEPDAPSAPIDSPDSANAIWVDSNLQEGRIIYGNPGEAPMLALTCLDDGATPAIRITRYSPADEGAGALLALIGNGHRSRLMVDATPAGEGFVWEGSVAADNPQLEVLTGTRGVTATLPGAGMITLNASLKPNQLIENCRGDRPAEPPPADDKAVS